MSARERKCLFRSWSFFKVLQKFQDYLLNNVHATNHDVKPRHIEIYPKAWMFWVFCMFLQILNSGLFSVSQHLLISCASPLAASQIDSHVQQCCHKYRELKCWHHFFKKWFFATKKWSKSPFTSFFYFFSLLLCVSICLSCLFPTNNAKFFMILWW